MHLICTDCRNVQDIKHTKEHQKIIKDMTEINNFSIYTQQTNFYGLCALCKV